MDQFAVRVATDETGTLTQPAQALQRLRGPGPRDEVAADENHVGVDLRQHRVERRQVAVDVVQHRDANHP